MAHRASFKSDMEYAITDLKEHYTLFEEEFNVFFPQLQQFVNIQIKI